MLTRKVTSSGQVTIPTILHEKFGIKAGTKINFVEDKFGIKIIPITYKTIGENIGSLGNGKPSLLKALMEEKKKEREL